MIQRCRIFGPFHQSLQGAHLQIFDNDGTLAWPIVGRPRVFKVKGGLRRKIDEMRDTLNRNHFVLHQTCKVHCDEENVVEE